MRQQGVKFVLLIELFRRGFVEETADLLGELTAVNLGTWHRIHLALGLAGRVPWVGLSVSGLVTLIGTGLFSGLCGGWMSSPIIPTEGYVYVPDSDPGVFAGATRGAVVRKPDRSPPWIVVDHTIETAIIARWPGRLWRVAVLDTGGVEQASDLANYTRALAVNVIDEIPASRLFGEHGEAVVAVLSYASRLDEATAERLATLRHPEADQAYSRAFQTWLDRVSPGSDFEESDDSGTLAAGQGPARSPLNYGLSLVHRLMWEQAETIAGPPAFVLDDEGERSLGPTWGGAASALLDAAMALGASSVATEDATVLLAAWKVVGESADNSTSDG